MSFILKITIPLFIISLVGFSILSGRVKEMKRFKRRSLFYAILAAIVYACSSLFYYLISYVSWEFLFISLVLFYSGLSIGHFFLSRIILPWIRKVHVFWAFLYLLIIACVGTIGYMYAYYFLSRGEFNSSFILPASFFFVPLFIYYSFLAFYDVPSKEFKKWYYPFGKAVEDPTDKELESPVVISFEFEKKFDDNELTTFRAKAPKYMKFGRLFYFFIDDYNNRHPEGKIEYIYDKSKPYGWIFYLKPTWYESQTFIDPDETIADNKIEENSVIICKRIMD